MPPAPTTAAEFIARLAHIKRWEQGGVRAPHKPLMLLLLLSRLARGEGRLVRFTEIEGQLRGLIEDYGPVPLLRQEHPPAPSRQRPHRRAGLRPVA